MATSLLTINESQDNRSAILAATVRLIAEHGVRGLRIEDVAKTAEVSPGLLYYHFDSRAGLIGAALEAAADAAPSMMLANGHGATGYEQVESALLAELDDDPSVRDYAVVWGEISATAVFEDELRAPVAKVWRRWRSLVAGALDRGVTDGSVKSAVQPEQTADMLITFVDGLCTRWLTGSLKRAKALDLLRARLADLSA